MINSINLQALRNSEFLQFTTDALGILALNGSKKLLIEDQYYTLLTASTALENLFKSDRGNPLTDEILALDLSRDNAITGISALVNAYTYHFDENTRQQALLLAKNLSLYGAGIARDNYMSETATLSSIIGDWKNKPELQTGVAALQLGPWLGVLEKANTQFNIKYLARTQELGAASPDNLKKKRAEATEAWYEVRGYLDSYFTINKGADPFAKATNELNALVDQYNTLLRSRSAKASDTAPAQELPKT